MLNDYGLQEIAQNYGLFSALIPVLITGIICGLIGAFGNKKLYWPSPKKNKDSFRKRVEVLSISFIVIFFLFSWYIFNLHLSWWVLIVLAAGSIVLRSIYMGRDSVVTMNHEKEIIFETKYSFAILIFLLLLGTFMHGFQDIAGMNEEILSQEEKKTFYIKNNDMKAFDVVDTKIDIDPLHRLSIYLHNLDEEPAQAEAILLSRDLQKKFQNTDPQFTQFLFGVESFTRKKYKRSEDILRNVGYSNLADISKVLNTAPLIAQTGIQNRFTLESELVPNAVEKFGEEVKSIVLKKSPDLPREEYVSNFKWIYWYNLMISIVSFCVVSYLFLFLGAVFIRKSLKPEYQN